MALYLYEEWSVAFLATSEKSGFIPRSVPSNPLHDSEHVKPFLSQISLMICREYGETDWILNDETFLSLKSILIIGW